MPHIVDPCYHLTDCTWSCSPADTDMSESLPRPMAQYLGASPAHPKRIKSVTIHWMDQDSHTIYFEKRADPDLIVFSLEMFDQIHDSLRRVHAPEKLDRVRKSLEGKTKAAAP